MAHTSIHLSGLKVVRELLERRPKAVRSVIFYRPEQDLKGGLEEIQRLATALGVTIQYREEKGDSRGGVAVEVEPLLPVPLEDILVRQSALPLIIGLDGVTDPQNFGAILRLADSVGAKGVFTAKDRSCPLTDVVRKVSSGASEFVPVSYVNNLAAAIREIKSAGYWIIGSALTPEAEDLYTATIPDPVCLLLGSEGQGLRRLSIELCDLIVKIPMAGTVQSLNVSQAGSVIAFEVLRRLRNGNKQD